jgi:subtilisin family serine protease
MKKLLLTLALALSFVGISNAQSQKYIVVLNDNANAQEVARSHSGRVTKFLKHAFNGYVVDMNEQAAQALRHNPNVKSVEENREIFPAEPTTIWNLDRADQRLLPLDGQYNYNHTGQGVYAYVIDSGIYYAHNDFEGRATLGQDWVGDGQNGNDCFGHGSHVAGIIGGRTYGVAKQVNLVSMRIGACNGGAQIYAMVEAIDWVIANGQRPAVINISYTAAGSSPSIDTAVTSAYTNGVSVVAAAGNSSYDACFFSPAGSPDAFTASATWDDDSRWLGANFGTCVDLFGQGMNVTSVGLGNPDATAVKGGTSMAAPMVAGGLALYLQQRPLDNATIAQQFIVDNATPDVISNPNGSPNKLLYTAFNVAPQVIPVCNQTFVRGYLTTGQTYYYPNLNGASGRNGLYTANLTVGQGVNALILLQKKQGQNWNTIQQSSTQIYSQQAKSGTFRFVVQGISGNAGFALCYNLPQ